LKTARNYGIQKAATGIRGFDELTFGGLPRGRPTLVCGGPGCGKTLMAIEFLVRGALEMAEPAVLISLDERIEDLEADSWSLGFDLRDLQDKKLLATDYVYLEREQFEESGEYDLEALFVRIAYAVESVGARRVVIDTIDNLFAGIPNEALVRTELRRLFLWLKDRNLTAVVTAERGEGSLTRHGIEEYISDCVILLDQRIHDELSTRRLRIVKYRGSPHGTNEYPFLIGEKGFSVLPITSLPLDHAASTERISTGIAGLDEILGGRGYYKGSSVLLTGGPGTGKTSIAAHLTHAACARGEHCVYFSFEESPSELLRNAGSIGIALSRWVDSGLLRLQSVRPSLGGLEMHLVLMHQIIEEHRPRIVVIDPLSALLHAGTTISAESTMLRLIDFLKRRDILAFYTGVGEMDASVSSLMDTWIVVSNDRWGDALARILQVKKARGMAHASEARQMSISEQGVRVHGHRIEQ
jgi:circadian clock protein KaiC